MSTRAARAIALGVATAVVAGAALAAPGATGVAAAGDVVVVPAEEVTDVAGPSVSADGRWVVFAGTVGGRRTVYRHDRHTGETIDLSPVPESVRAGDTISPRLSADGCVVVALTEVAFDVFRDDDRGERWDVYRLVAPECGGRPNAWELVSAATDGTALDAVFPDSPPTLSGSGALVAYVRQAPRAPAGVGAIDVVDLTVPITEPARATRAPGLPAEPPSHAFRYRGATHPVLSENGRHLAFVSDATAHAALPGWADGPSPGDAAVAQVYVWDRLADDQRRSVHLMSGHDGQPSAAGADSPAVSEDGRVVVFRSADQAVVPATLPTCADACPTQIYRYDRDTDGNGIFDESSDLPPLTIASAVDAGVVEGGLPVAGDGASWSPAVSADGSQVAFVTDATNLLPSRRSGGGGPEDGDLLVAEHHLGRIRRVLDRPDHIGVPGAHDRPALSRTGSVIAFDTIAAATLDDSQQAVTRATRTVVSVEVGPDLSLAALDFGTVVPGLESAELYTRVLNAGPAGFEPAIVETSSPEFRITGGTCSPGVIVAAGESCSVSLTFTPSGPASSEATLSVRAGEEDGAEVSTVLAGAGGEPVLLAEPGGVDVASSAVVGEAGNRSALDIRNVGLAPTEIVDVAIGGVDPGDFVMASESCTGRALNPGATCAVEVEFDPAADGYRSALLTATTQSGQSTSAVLGGFARYRPTLRTAAAQAGAGGEIGIGGSGFPAGAEVAIGFDGVGGSFAGVTTDDDGAFLAVVTLPARLRAGTHRLVAWSADGAVATTELDVVGRRAGSPPLTPGYGLG